MDPVRRALAGRGQRRGRAVPTAPHSALSSASFSAGAGSLGVQRHHSRHARVQQRPFDPGRMAVKGRIQLDAAGDHRHAGAELLQLRDALHPKDRIHHHRGRVMLAVEGDGLFLPQAGHRPARDLPLLTPGRIQSDPLVPQLFQGVQQQPAHKHGAMRDNDTLCYPNSSSCFGPRPSAGPAIRTIQNNTGTRALTARDTARRYTFST